MSWCQLEVSSPSSRYVEGKGKVVEESREREESRFIVVESGHNMTKRQDNSRSARGGPQRPPTTVRVTVDALTFNLQVNSIVVNSGTGNRH